MEDDLYLNRSADGQEIFKFIVTRFNLRNRDGDERFVVSAMVDDGILTEYDLRTGRYCDLEEYSTFFDRTYAGDYIEMTPDDLLSLLQSRYMGTEYYQTKDGVRGFYTESSTVYVRKEYIYSNGTVSEPVFSVERDGFIDDKMAELDTIRKPYKWYDLPEDPNVSVLEFESNSWETISGRHPIERYTYTFYQPAIRNMSSKRRCR